jgi:hypothetical protein
MKALALLAVAAFLFNVVAPANARETKTQIGKWKDYSGGGIDFSIIDKDGRKSAVIFVTDEHIIETNYFSVSKKDLEKIKALIDETLKEM